MEELVLTVDLLTSRIKYHKIADDLMKAALEINQLGVIDEVSRLGSISDEVLAETLNAIIRLAIQKQDDDKYLKRCVSFPLRCGNLWRRSSVRSTYPI